MIQMKESDPHPQESFPLPPPQQHNNRIIQMKEFPPHPDPPEHEPPHPVAAKSLI